MHSLRKIQLVLWLVVFTTFIYSQIPDGYYTAANGKAGATLKTSIYSIIHTHTQLEYYHLSIDFQSTDWRPEGYYWDMYSNNLHSSWNGLNREHSLPKSWFGITSETVNSSPMGTDLHNLYPSDATANTAKNNFPLGEVNGTPDFTNGVVKVGSSTSYSPSYNGTVFEPANEYKGDFARDYMYMVTCYETFTGWTSTGTLSMLLNGSYPAFRDKAITLLMKWHRQDPVSQKEIDRNNAVFKLQHNRNPFVDHPELAEFIWGKYVGSPWDMNGSLPEEDLALTVQPNPVSSKLTVKVNKPTQSTYYVKTLSGITLKTGHFDTDGSMTVDDLKNDLYLLVVYSETSRKVAKFEVRH